MLVSEFSSMIYPIHFMQHINWIIRNIFISLSHKNFSPWNFHPISSFFFFQNFFFFFSPSCTQKKNQGRKVEQKKSIYGTAANDGKTGNKINLSPKKSTQKPLRRKGWKKHDEFERESKHCGVEIFPTMVELFKDDLANFLLFLPLCFLFL